MKNEKWTKDKMPDLSGKIILVTGGNSGLGYESVKAFAEKGAEVISACRSVEKGEQAKARIGNVPGKIVVMELDLASLESVRNFAGQFKKAYARLDILLNNAGIMMTPYFLTKDNLEGQSGVNHFGHFALTGLLMDLILKTPGARIVNVSSNAHKWGKMDWENPLFGNGKDYTPVRAYGRSKLSNLLFPYELKRRLEAKGVDAIAVAAHPGGSATNLDRHLRDRWFYKVLKPIAPLLMQSQEMGALPQIRAAVDPEVKGGEYYGPGGFSEMKGYPVRVASNEDSHSVEDARKLWEFSEKMTQVRFPV